MNEYSGSPLKRTRMGINIMSLIVKFPKFSDFQYISSRCGTA